jgi:hypothetical protein
MSDYYQYPAEINREALACEYLINTALVGALVGGSAAAAKNALAVRNETMQFGDALRDTGRTAMASGLATAVGAVAANTVTDQGLLRLSLMFGVGAAVLYGLNQWAERKETASE